MCGPSFVGKVLRFFWKATPDSMDHQGVKCKIMRPVSDLVGRSIFRLVEPDDGLWVGRSIDRSVDSRKAVHLSVF